MVRALRVRRTSKRSSFFLHALLSRGRARYNTIYNTCAVRILYTLYIVYVYSTRIYIIYTRIRQCGVHVHTCRRCRQRRPPWHWAGARVSSPSRELTKSTVCRTLRGGRVHPRTIYNDIYACLRYPAVRACAADAAAAASAIISERGDRGQSDSRMVVGGRAGRGAERERSRPSWGRTRRACAARKQTAGWIFVFTFHVVIAPRRVIIHKYTI